VHDYRWRCRPVSAGLKQLQRPFCSKPDCRQVSLQLYDDAARNPYETTATRSSQTWTNGWTRTCQTCKRRTPMSQAETVLMTKSRWRIKRG